MDSDSANTEADLRRAEERFRLVVESSPAAMVIVDQTGQIVLVNRQTENWFGYTRAELIGQEVEVLIPNRFHDRHRGDRNEYFKSPQSRPMGAGHDLFGRRKDGSEFPVDISLHPMETESAKLVLAHIVDLTDRKQAEFELKRRHSLERLALLGQLAAGVSHEIRNPLGVIRNAAYYLQMIADSLDEEARASVTEIQREVERANRIVGDLLDYVRDPHRHTETFDVSDRVRRFIDEQKSSLGISIILAESDEPAVILADADQIERIVENLLRNAAQASDEDSAVTVTVRRDDVSVIIEVSDAGTGIEDGDRFRVFEPLFTTKARGIGLGLAISKRYAELNDGQLELVDRSGPGSTFRLTLSRILPN